MFTTENAKVDNGFKEPQFISIGPNELKINSFDIIEAKNGSGKVKIQVNVETRPVGGDFEGWEGALGRIGRFDLSIYFDPESKSQAKQDFLDKIASIGFALNLSKDLDEIKINDVREYLNAVQKLFANKYAWYIIGGEEYEGKDAEGNPKVKISLKLMRFNYVAPTEEALLNKQKDKVWPDKSNPYFFKYLEKMDAEEINKTAGTGQKDDLPF